MAAGLLGACPGAGYLHAGYGQLGAISSRTASNLSKNFTYRQMLSANPLINAVALFLLNFTSVNDLTLDPVKSGSILAVTSLGPRRYLALITLLLTGVAANAMAATPENPHADLALSIAALPFDLPMTPGLGDGNVAFDLPPRQIVADWPPSQSSGPASTLFTLPNIGVVLLAATWLMLVRRQRG
jgi:hypothetical protein